jgi:hypothetical protein
VDHTVRVAAATSVPSSAAIARRSAKNITKNHPPNAVAGIQNARMPFQANGQCWAIRQIAPGTNRIAHHRLS